MLAACGQNADGQEKESSGSEKKSDGVLSVMTWDDNQAKGLQKILDDFTKETGIKAETGVVKWDEYWTMLDAGARGGTLPDVFWMHSNEAERYMTNGLLLDLTDKIESSDRIDLANYPEDIVNYITMTTNSTQCQKMWIPLLCGIIRRCLTRRA